MPFPFLLFGLLSIIEIALFTLAVYGIGLGNTLLLTAATSFLGLKILQRQGIGRPTAGETAAGLSLDAFRKRLLRYLSGILLILPGFLTDLGGIALFFPFGRRFFLYLWERWIKKRFSFGFGIPSFDPFSIFGNGYRGETTMDADFSDKSTTNNKNNPNGNRADGDDDIIDVDYEVKS